jgi:hypothetical protein
MNRCQSRSRSTTAGEQELAIGLYGAGTGSGIRSLVNSRAPVEATAVISKRPVEAMEAFARGPRELDEGVVEQPAQRTRRAAIGRRDRFMVGFLSGSIAGAASAYRRLLGLFDGEV